MRAKFDRLLRTPLGPAAVAAVVDIVRLLLHQVGMS